MDNDLDILNKELKERAVEIEEQLRKSYTQEEWYNYLKIKNEFVNNSNLLKKKNSLSRPNKQEIAKQNLEEIEAYNSCLSIIKDTIGIKCKHCGSFNILPYYYGTLYPSIIDSKTIQLDKNYKYGGLEKNGNSKSYYCKKCNRDFQLFW